MRQDLLDQIIWAEVVRLLEDPTLIQQELDRRLAAARSSDPTKHREQSLQSELTRVGKSLERLLTAYQEGLLSLEQLRERIPALRQREQMLRAELQAIADQANDRANFLRLAETLTAFLARLRSAADTLDVTERQRIVRLVIKEILVGDDTIIIRHCIPVASGPRPNDGSPPTPGGTDSAPRDQSYLLRKGSELTALRRSFVRRSDQACFEHTRGKNAANELEQTPVGDPFGNQPHQDVVVHAIEELLDVDVHHRPAARRDKALRAFHRLMRRAPRSESEARTRRTIRPMPFAALAAPPAE